MIADHKIVIGHDYECCRRNAHGSIQLWNRKLTRDLALASMARDDLPASSTAAAMRGKVGSEFET